MEIDRIGIAMSGGVDSTAAALLLGENYTVSGFFMDTGQPDFKTQLERVTSICSRLEIELQVVDLRTMFKQAVLDYFTGTYRQGKTPNPCAVCNKEIKFGLLMDRILASGSRLGATGHYARVTEIDGHTALLKGVDPGKDQSYFLARLDRAQLERVLFPLGSMYKRDTYTYVESRGFTDFRGMESQDVCFFSDDDLGSYLAENLEDSMQRGPIVTRTGEQIGQHDGLFRYTVGQRRGLGLPHHSPWYVYALEPEHNRLIVCKEEDLYSSVVTALSPNWLGPEPQPGSSFTVKTRSTHPGTAARLATIDAASFTLEFNEPQRAVTPGQFIVLYDGELVIGSGEMTRASGLT